VDVEGGFKALYVVPAKRKPTIKALKDALKESEALIIATEWKEFTTVDLRELHKVMHTSMIFDGRNLLDPHTVRAAGFQYTSIGRS
jgi:UDPglucose 6-dehydrogenase